MAVVVDVAEVFTETILSVVSSSPIQAHPVGAAGENVRTAVAAGAVPSVIIPESGLTTDATIDAPVPNPAPIVGGEIHCDAPLSPPAAKAKPGSARKAESKPMNTIFLTKLFMCSESFQLSEASRFTLQNAKQETLMRSPAAGAAVGVKVTDVCDIADSQIGFLAEVVTSEAKQE